MFDICLSLQGLLLKVTFKTARYPLKLDIYVFFNDLPVVRHLLLQLLQPVQPLICHLTHWVHLCHYVVLIVVAPYVCRLLQRYYLMGGTTVGLLLDTEFADEIFAGLAVVRDGFGGVERAGMGESGHMIIEFVQRWYESGWQWIKQSEQSRASIEAIEFACSTNKLMETCQPLSSKSSLISQIAQFAHHNGDLLTKFSVPYLTQTLDLSKLYRLSSKFDPATILQPEEFVSLVASMVPHRDNQTLFLVMSLEELCCELQSNNSMRQENGIRLSDFTDLFCEKITERDPYLVLPQKQQPQGDSMTFEELPCINYLCSHELPLLSKTEKVRQKSLSNSLVHFQFAASFNKIIALSLLSTKIEIFTQDLKIWRQLTPKISKQLKKQFVIMSFGYDDRSQRIGFVLKNIGLIFYEAGDDFQTEKLIEGVRAEKISFLKLVDSWVTIASNSLTFWNLNLEKPRFCIEVPEAAQVICFEEIAHVKKLIVSFIYKDEGRWLHIYDLSNPSQIPRLVSKLPLSSSGCHTLHYHVNTQSIIRLGYHNKVIVSQIDPLSNQLVIVAELAGHQTIVTSATSIQGTSVLVTGDDKGYVRLWDLAYMRCYQVMRLNREIKGLESVGKWIMFGDRRINMMMVDYPMREATSCLQFFTSVYDSNMQNLYLFSHHECLRIDMGSGRMVQEFVMFEGEEEITCAKRIKNNLFVGTNRGNISIYDMSFKKKKQARVSDDGIVHIVSDSQDLIVMAMSSDGVLNIWNHDDSLQDDYKKCITGLVSEHPPELLQFSQRDCLIATNLQPHAIFLFDYETLRLLAKIVIPFSFSHAKFHPIYPILLVLTDAGSLYAITYAKKEIEVKIKSVTRLDWKGLDDEDGELVSSFELRSQCVYIGSNKGNLSIFKLNEFLDQLPKPKVIPFGERSPTMHRPVIEKLSKQKLSSNQIYTVVPDSVPTFKLGLLKFKNLSRGPILKADIFEDNLLICILSTQGRFSMHEISTLKCFSLRAGKHPLPQKWKKGSVNLARMKDQIVRAIKLVQKMHNFHFSPDMRQQVNFEGLDVTRFLSKIIAGDYSMPETKKLSLNSSVELIKSFHQPSLPPPVPLKYMETEKRLRQQHESKKENKRSMSSSDPVKVCSNLAKQVMNDDFFRPSYREKLLRNSTKSKNEEPCELWDRINRRINSRDNKDNMTLSRSRKKLRKLNSLFPTADRKLSIKQSDSFCRTFTNIKEEANPQKQPIDRDVLKKFLKSPSNTSGLKKVFNPFLITKSHGSKALRFSLFQKSSH